MSDPGPFGYLIPALVLSSHSLFIYLSILRNYLSSGGRNKSDCFRTAASYRLPNGFPLEAYLKVLIGLMAVFACLFVPSSEVFENRLHHILIVTALVLSGITDLLVFYGWNLPSGTSYLMLTFFHAISAFSMTFNQHGGPVMILLHQLLSYVLILATLSCIIEWENGDNVLVAALRPYSVLFAATWLVQISYHVMENMKETHENVSKTLALIPCFFMFHSIACILIMALAGYAFSKYCATDQRGSYFKISRELSDD